MSAIPFLREPVHPPGHHAVLAPGVERLQGDNPGPFTYTGTGVFLLSDPARSDGAVMVVDPGPDSAAHRAALLAAIGRRKVSHILLTHHHLDHTAAVPWLRAETGAPVCGYPSPEFEADGAHPEGGDDGRVRPDRELGDGDRVRGDGVEVEAIHTPGHASNHLCYRLRERLFCGDHVMGWSTSVVVPPDGSMADYLRSLERVRTMAREGRVRTLHPTHGPAIAEPEEFVAALIAHRQAREAGVLAAVEAGIVDIPAMVERLYVELDPRLVPAASQSVLAHLIALRAEGRVGGDRPDGLACRYAAGGGAQSGAGMGAKP